MKLKAELWDKIQYLFRNYYDRMMHAVLYLDGCVNYEILRKSLSYLLKSIPVLRSRYIASVIRPYWVVNEDDLTDKALSLITTDNPEKELEDFITGHFESDQAPELRIKVIRNSGKDILAFLINHQCFDGADFKNFLYKLAESYNDAVKGGSGEVNIKSGNRGLEQVYSSMTKEEKKEAKNLIKNISKTKEKIVFPLTESHADDRAMLNRHKIDAATFKKMKEYGKKRDATLNDVILTAYIRSFSALKNLEEGRILTIPGMTDLRRHIKVGETAGFTNMTCIVPCAVKIEKEN
jgi:NRPS condensation-like uncharacterized protein